MLFRFIMFWHKTVFLITESYMSQSPRGEVFELWAHRYEAFPLRHHFPPPDKPPPHPHCLAKRYRLFIFTPG
jgi:hypothetical protein